MNSGMFHAECNFGGFLLLASPKIRDSSFHRSAVLLQDHQRDCGAFGFVIDRPLGKQLWQAMPCMDDFGQGKASAHLAEIPLWQGGPCEMDRLILTSLDWQLDGRAILTPLHDLEQASEYIDSGKKVRAFLGYSAWGSGQLERELNAGSWLITPPKPSLFEQDFQISGAWKQHLQIMGPEMSMLAHAPLDLRAN